MLYWIPLNLRRHGRARQTWSLSVALPSAGWSQSRCLRRAPPMLVKQRVNDSNGSPRPHARYGYSGPPGSASEPFRYTGSSPGLRRRPTGSAFFHPASSGLHFPRAAGCRIRQLQHRIHALSDALPSQDLQPRQGDHHRLFPGRLDERRQKLQLGPSMISTPEPSTRPLPFRQMIHQCRDFADLCDGQALREPGAPTWVLMFKRHRPIRQTRLPRRLARDWKPQLGQWVKATLRLAASCSLCGTSHATGRQTVHGSPAADLRYCNDVQNGLADTRAFGQRSGPC